MNITSKWSVGTAKAGRLVAGGLIAAWLAAGCARGSNPEEINDEGLMCGPGTVQKGACVSSIASCEVAR